MNQALIQELSAWDGTHRDYLLEIYQKNITQAGFFEDLVEIYQHQVELQVVCSWLVKHQYDLKKTIPQTLINQILNHCPSSRTLGSQTTCFTVAASLGDS